MDGDLSCISFLFLSLSLSLCVGLNSEWIVCMARQNLERSQIRYKEGRSVEKREREREIVLQLV